MWAKFMSGRAGARSRGISSRGWEIAFSRQIRDGDSSAASLSQAVGHYALRLEEILTASPSLPAPQCEAGSAISMDDRRPSGIAHGDLTVSHQVGHRLLVALDHLANHSSGWLVRRKKPPFRVYAEFSVLRGAIESVAAAWWIISPEDSAERVKRALAIKKSEGYYEDQAMRLDPGRQPTGPGKSDFRKRLDLALGAAADEIGISFDEIPATPHTSTMIGTFGGDSEIGKILPYVWRECSSYAHGYDWASWHNRGGLAQGWVPYKKLAEVYITSCEALNLLWIDRWAPLALKDFPNQEKFEETSDFLPLWEHLNGPHF